MPWQTLVQEGEIAYRPLNLAICCAKKQLTQLTSAALTLWQNSLLKAAKLFILLVHQLKQSFLCLHSIQRGKSIFHT